MKFNRFIIDRKFKSLTTTRLVYLKWETKFETNKKCILMVGKHLGIHIVMSCNSAFKKKEQYHSRKKKLSIWHVQQSLQP